MKPNTFVERRGLQEINKETEEVIDYNLFPEQEQMGFKKIKAKVKKARGGGADMTIKTLGENWDEWKDMVASLDDAEREEIAEKFEDACTGAGDAIQAATAEEFDGEAKSWSPEDKDAFANLLCPEYFECEE